MKYFLPFIVLSTLLTAAPMPPMLPPSNPHQEIVIHNRILTTVNGKTISVLDVKKRMDAFLSQYYPQYLDSKPACFQFYSMQWRQTLQQMVDQELMLADAESREIKATDAEVREEIQNRYGPNVRGSLDKLDITYEEAKKMVHNELVAQKIQWLRVTSKVLSRVTTDVVRKAYNEHLKKNPPKEMWTYQFLTLRYDSVDTAMSLAQQLTALRESAGSLLPVAADLFKQKLPQEEWKHITLSSELQAEDKELSSAHREVLTKLSPNTWSEPVVQQSRDGSHVIRIFHLKNHTKQETPTFENLATGLRQEILNKEAEKEMEVYLTRLHERFGYDQNSLEIPAQFEPFTF